MSRRTECKLKKALIILIVAVIFITIGVIFGSDILASSNSNASIGQDSYKYYTSIEVKKGDTLWAIAETYISDEYNDREKYVEEVVALNDLQDTTIHTGQFLTVPYYASEFK